MSAVLDTACWVRNLNQKIMQCYKVSLCTFYCKYLLLVEKQFWEYSLYQLNHYWHER